MDENRIRFSRNFDETLDDTLKVLEENSERREKEILKDALDGTDIMALERLKIVVEDIYQPFPIRYLAATCYSLICDFLERESQVSDR